MYHISDIKKFLHCERLYYLDKDEDNVFKPYLRSDESINDLIKKYLKIETCFEGIRNDADERFFDNKDAYEWFVHPRFEEDGLRINIPFMHKRDTGFDLYFIYFGTQVRDLDLLNYRICLAILNNKGLHVDDIFLIYFNGEYVSDGNIDVDKLFITIDSFKEERIIDIVEEKGSDHHSFLKKMAKGNLEAYPPKKCRYCRTNGLCDHYHDCFPTETEIPDDSILTLVSSKNKNLMKEEGIEHLKDADLDRIEGNRVQYAQIMASKNQGLFIDKLALNDWLSHLNERPISFVDFEWDRYLIPPYAGMRPMDVVCFEFALYYIDENGHMEHRTFVGTGDCRKEFLEGLIEYLPKKGPILAYNAAGAECLRLEELSEIYPEYKEEILRINERFVDLAIPFIEGLVYDVRMQGNYTLKKLVDICSDYSYKDLDIYDGMEAVYSWRDIDKGKNIDKEKIVDELKEYCSLDAYGLFLVYRWLIELIVETNK